MHKKEMAFTNMQVFILKLILKLGKICFLNIFTYAAFFINFSSFSLIMSVVFLVQTDF